MQVANRQHHGQQQQQDAGGNSGLADSSLGPYLHRCLGSYQDRSCETSGFRHYSQTSIWRPSATSVQGIGCQQDCGRCAARRNLPIRSSRRPKDYGCRSAFRGRRRSALRRDVPDRHFGGTSQIGSSEGGRRSAFRREQGASAP